MFYRIAPDSTSGDDGLQQSADTNCPSDVVELPDPAPSGSYSHVHDENKIYEADSEQRASVMQMAFIQMMTQKVLEATANNPGILDQLNSSIKIDKD